MTDVIIQPAEEGDARAILEMRHESIHNRNINDYSDEIMNAWSPGVSDERIERMQERIRSTDFYVLVAKAGEDVLGYGGILPEKNIFGALYVKKNKHGGVGKKILEQLLQYAKKEGVLFLEGSTSLNAEDFYAKNGFTILEKSTHRIGRSEIEMPCVKMRIDL